MNFSEYSFINEVIDHFKAQGVSENILRDIEDRSKPFIEVFSHGGIDNIVDIFKAYNEFKSPFKNDDVDNDNGDGRCFDYRFLKIGADNFRIFPKSDKKFGISFQKINTKETDKKIEACSFIGLGNNGVGKSSFFGAMEWKCTGKVSEYEFRNSDCDDSAKCSMADFITHHDKNNSLPDGDNVRIITVDTEHDFKAFSLSPFFCTEKDLIEMVKEMPKKDVYGKDDWVPYIFTFSGYKLINKLIDSLNLVNNEIEKNERMEDRLDFSGIDEKVNKAIKQFGRIDADDKAYKDFKSIDVKRQANLILKSLDNFNVDKSLDKKIEKLIGFLYKYREKFNDLKNITNDEKTDINTIIENIVAWAYKITDVNNGFISIDSYKHDGEMLFSSFLNMHQKLLTSLNLRIENIHSKFVDTLNDIKILPRKLHPWQEYRDDWIALKNKIKALFSYCKDKRSEIAKSIANNDFFELIENFMIENRFLEKGQEKLNHEISGKDIRFNIKKVVDGTEDKPPIPVAVYFNTFRSKLVALMLRIGLAMSIMQREKVLFPLVFDDIFYSSDFDNKYKLIAFFRSVFKTPVAINGQKKQMQMIFFTHDELMISICREALTALDISNNMIYARLLAKNADYDEWDLGEFALDDNEKDGVKCFNMAFNLFEDCANI